MLCFITLAQPDQILCWEDDSSPTPWDVVDQESPVQIGLKHFNASKAFIEYSNDIDNVYKSIEECT